MHTTTTASLKHDHVIEMLALKTLETVIDYRINNPELIAQRNKVRRLKDKIIVSESYEDYKRNYKPVCRFNADDYCDKTINYTYHQWVSYGNCCKTCTRYINRKANVVYGIREPQHKTKFEIILEELAELDKNEMD